MFKWYFELTGAERRTFWACFAGWSLDAMDVQVFTFIIPYLMVIWTITSKDVGFLGAASLFSASIGGWLGGYLADKYGRVFVMQFTILWFAVFTFIAGLTQTYDQLLIVRVLQGIGFGGEWGAGAVLLGEVVRPDHRGKSVGCLQSGYAIGWGLATLLATGTFIVLPQTLAWRVLLMMSAAPALFVVYVRKAIKDAPVYGAEKQAQESRSRKPGILSIFRTDVLRVTVLSSALAAGLIGAGSAIVTWLPTFLRTELELSTSQVGLYMGVVTLGSFFGYIASAYLADAAGRRPNFLLYSCFAWFVTLFYMCVPMGKAGVLMAGFPLGFFMAGSYGCLGPYFTELFPTDVRATGQSFAYSFGKCFGALVVAVIGALALHVPLRVGVGAMALICYSIAVIATLMLPETRGLHLAPATKAQEH